MRNSFGARRMIAALAAILLCIVLAPGVAAQSEFFDGFEDGDVNGWTMLSGDGQIAISQEDACNGLYSMKISGSSTNDMPYVRRDGFSDFAGVYEVCFRNQSPSPILFLFQHQDAQNFYGVFIANMVGAVGLFVEENDVATDIYGTSGLTPSAQVNLKVSRTASGLITLYYNGQQLYTGNDETFMTDGGIRIVGTGAIYVDDVQFRKAEGPDPIPTSSAHGLVILALLLAGVALWSARARLLAHPRN
jgi:hypothetical protein